MAPLKIGIVGCGMIAKCNHLPSLLSLPKLFTITAMCDIVPGKAQKLAAEKNVPGEVKFCANIRTLLKQDLDAVVIATPNSCHYPQTLEALNAGKHVLVEKPMATSTKEADEMIDLAEKLGLVLQVNQSFRYMASMNMLADLIQKKNAIGAPRHIHCIRASTQSPDIAWSPGATWFVQKKYHGSLVGDIAVHMADLMQWCFGPVKTVQAQNTCTKHEVVDDSIVLFRYENGATGALELSWTFPQGRGELEIYGEDGAIYQKADCFEIWKRGGKKPKIVKFSAAKKFPCSQEAFYRSITKGGVKSWTFGRKAIALCEAIEKAGQSAKAEKPVYRKEK